MVTRQRKYLLEFTPLSEIIVFIFSHIFLSGNFKFFRLQLLMNNVFSFTASKAKLRLTSAQFPLIITPDAVQLYGVSMASLQNGSYENLYNVFY
jgi:hypothetical protein